MGSHQAFSTAGEEPAGSITFRADTPGATNLEDLFSRCQGAGWHAHCLMCCMPAMHH